jgi:hypothetical protein
MCATYLTCYFNYYEQKQYTSDIEYDKACAWTSLRVKCAKAELAKTGEERKDEVVQRAE